MVKEGGSVTLSCKVTGNLLLSVYLGLMVKEGGSVTLSCKVTGNPVPTVTWRRNENVLHEGSSLTLYNINRFHTGVYTCTADNNIGPAATGDITMEVMYPPVVDTGAPRVLGGVGRKVELSCTVLAQPEPEVRWFKNGNQEIQPDPGVTSFWSNSTQHFLIFHRLST